VEYQGDGMGLGEMEGGREGGGEEGYMWHEVATELD
jgi:hypothetical protein